MIYKGHVEDGAIVLDDPVTLPDGATVKVELAEDRQAADEAGASTLMECYGPFIGALDGMPEDWSENHDKYFREEHQE